MLGSTLQSTTVNHLDKTGCVATFTQADGTNVVAKITGIWKSVLFPPTRKEPRTLFGCVRILKCDQARCVSAVFHHGSANTHMYPTIHSLYVFYITI